MKQKIKKFSYKIPLKSSLIESGYIEVSTFDIPNVDEKKDNQGGVCIKVKVDDNIKGIEQTEESIVIPRRQIKTLRKALKKISRKI
ncbi:hypothetical protein [Helicobacter turcicus]|uniref:Uncharacterized protein n=1 Tax=Helicobacter turcicus TaxID=2867412 RepID=A0ABS7JNP2_9HELI|nr:hypothetical protein [Helicobacter turcicus]MBX7491011.1 hypothetical protein [Helicobacter turcicus]MBX7545862.1 hypothetical protein [Helicobacter turcicus]